MNNYKRFFIVLLCFIMFTGQIAYATTPTITLNVNSDGSLTVKWTAINDAVSYDFVVGNTALTKLYIDTKVLTTDYTATTLPKDETNFRVVVSAIDTSGRVIGSLDKSIFFNSENVNLSDDVKIVDFISETDLDNTEEDSLGNIDSNVIENEQSTDKRMLAKEGISSRALLASPRNLKSISTLNSITLQWDAVKGAMYESKFSGAETKTTSSTSRQEYNLEPGTYYIFSVRSKNDSGNSGYSYKYMHTLSEAPLNITSKSTDTSITIRWNFAKGASGYEVEYNSKIYKAKPSYDYNNKLVGWYCTIPDLTPNRSYTYRVRSTNSGGEGPYSPYKTVRTLLPTPILSATSTTTTATISYGVKEATEYEINFNGTIENIKSTSKTFTALKPGTKYNYTVKAKNQYVESESVIAKGTVTTLPEVPTNVEATPTDTSVTVKWTGVVGASSYEITFDGKVYSVNSTLRSYTVSKLIPNTNHTYSVRAKNAGGLGASSPNQTVRTLLATPLITSSTSTTNSVTLQWTAVSGATSYNIDVKGTIYSTKSTSKTITDLVPGTKYDFKITAQNSNTKSASASKSVTTLPEVPMDVSATSTHNSVNVKWSRVVGATGYEITFNGKVHSTDSISYSFYSLNSNTSYTYSVRAKNAGGLGASTPKKTIRTLLATPSSPTVTSTTNSVTLQWNAVSGATSYDIDVNGTIYNTTSTSKTITGLDSGTRYTINVTAKNADTKSNSTSKIISTLPQGALNIRDTVASNSVTVKWDAVVGATVYELTFNGRVYNSGSTSHTVSGLTPNTKYNYSLQAKNATGKGPSSQSYTTRTLLATPTGLKATATSTSVTLQWGALLGATSYEVDFNGNTYNSTSTTITIKDLTPNKSYIYKIKAKSKDVESAYTPNSTVRTSPATPDATVTSTSNSITVSWPPVAGATTYSINFNGVVYSTTSTSRTFKNLAPDTNYTYSILAKNSSGESGYSDIKTIKTPPLKPQTPSNVGTTATSNSATVSWDAVPGATSYNISFNGKVHTTTATSITLTGLMSDTNYNYSVQAKNANGDSSYSAAKTIRTLSAPPVTPSNIDIAPTNNSIQFSWPKVSGATSYSVSEVGTCASLGKTSRSIEATISRSSAPAKSITTDKLVAVFESDDYICRVYAITANGPNGSSEPALIKASATIPVPANIVATADSKSVTINWDKVKATTDYTVKFNDKEYNTKDTKITINGLNENKLHSFAVGANVTDNSGVKKGTYSKTNAIRTTGNTNSGRITPNKNGYFDGKKKYDVLDPVDAFSGAYVWDYTFLTIDTKDSMEFNVNYNSQSDYNGTLGKKWTHSYDYKLEAYGKNAYFNTPYGEIISFSYYYDKIANKHVISRDQNNNYIPISVKDDEYSIKYIDGTEYVFDKNLYLKEIRVNGITKTSFQTNTLGQITKITGQYGSSFVLNYADNKIQNIKDYLGSTVSFLYNDGNLNEARNADGDKLSFTYDSFSNITKVSDFSGEIYLTNSYNDTSQIIKQTIVGRGDSFAEYDDKNAVNVFTDELGNKSKYYYDGNQNIAKIEHALGVVYNDYNSNGQIIGQTDELGNVTKMSYDNSGRLSDTTYPDGTSEKISYNSFNLPVKFTNGDGSEINFAYDVKGNLTSITDERGKTEYYQYDANNNLLSFKDKNGYVSRYTYDSSGQLKSYTDPVGAIYNYSYDSIGRLVSTESPTGKVTTYKYTPEGKLTTITENGETQIFTYDKNGSTTSITDKMGHTQYFAYDAMGNTISETDFLNNKQSYSYDKRGLLSEHKDPLKYKETYVYDAVGNLSKVTDKNGNVTKNIYDGASQLIEIKAPQDSSMKFSYDKKGQVTSTIDPNNNATSFSYDKMGRVLSITNALGNPISFIYDKSGNILTETDENGMVTKYSYDDDNNLLSIESNQGIVRLYYDKAGRLIEVKDEANYSEKTQYDSDGNVTSSSDKEGNTTRLIYNIDGYLVEEVDALGNVTKYEYDKNGNRTKVIDSNNNIYSYSYNANNALIKIVDPMGYETLLNYNARGENISIVDANGNKTSFEYDGNGNVVKEINPVGGSVQYTYDTLNNLVKIQDENGYIKQFSYDKAGNKIGYIDANSNSWNFVYDAINRPTNITDSNGNHINLTYDKKDNIVKLVDQDGAVTKYEYDSKDRLTSISDALGNSTKFSYNAIGNLTEYNDANGNSTKYTYTPNGKVSTVTEAEGNTVSYTYNAMGLTTGQTDSMGNTTKYTHDSMGQVLSMTDAIGNKTHFTYNVKGEITSVKDAKGNKTEYQYDGNGNLLKTINANGEMDYYEYDSLNQLIKQYNSSNKAPTLYQYDKKGQRIKEILPVQGERTYKYDGNGNVATVIDEENNKTSYEYNSFDLMSSVAYADGKKAIYKYNKVGKLIQLDDWNGTTSFEQDLIGRLTKATDHKGNSTAYTYDNVGNKLSMLYPDGSMVRYAYDKNKKLKSVTEADNAVTNYEYDKNQNTTKISQPNGDVTDYKYNSLGLVTNISYMSKGEQRVSNNISYDEMGNIISSVKESASSLWSSTKKYSYDKVNQLISYKENGDITNYSYDGSGNMVKKSSSFEPDILYNYNALNQLTEKTVGTTQYNYSYDNRGNLKSEKVNGVVSKTYVFDGTDHLVEGNNVETGEQSKYTYNALDVRVRLEQRVQNTNSSYSNSENFNTPITPSTLAKEETNPFISDLSPKEEIKPSVPTIKGAITQSNPFVERDISYVVDYVSDNNNEIMLLEKDSYSTAIVYGRNSERLVQKTTLPPSNNKDLDIQKPNVDIVSEELGKVYFQSDILGHAIFASDDSGNVMSYMEYDPWGKIVTPYLGDMNTSGLDSMNRFTNHTYDSVIDKYFAQARFYDAENSRMISIDPEYSDSNLYSYVFNNPVNYTDPDGKIPVIVIPIVKFIASISLKKVAKEAAFSALKGVIAEVADKLLNEGDELNFKDILISAGTGALSGVVSDIIKQKTEEESKVKKEAIKYTSKFILNVIKSLGTKLLEGKPITIDEITSTLKKSLRKTAIDFVFQKAKKKDAIKIGKITMDRDLPWILNTVIDLFGEEFKNNILDLMGSKINSENSKSPVKAEYNRKPNPRKLMPRDRSLTEEIEPIGGSPTNTSNTLQDKYNNHLNETKNDRRTPLANEYYMICTPKAKKKAEGQSPKSHDNKTNKQNENARGYQTQWYLDSNHKDPRKNSKATNIKNPLSMPARETNMIKYYALHRTTGQRLYKYATEGTYVKHPNWASNMWYR